MKKHWWRAQSANYLFRMNSRTAAYIRNQRLALAEVGRVPLPLPVGTVSVHVRHGDKFKEVPPVPFDEYLRRLRRMAQVFGLPSPVPTFLSTEDPAVIHEARTNNDLLIFNIPYERFNYRDISEIQREGPPHLLNDISNILLAVESSYFMGALAIVCMKLHVPPAK